MLTVTRRFEFCYGHKLPGYDGKCANLHGHNSVLEIEVSGQEGIPYSGMVTDFGDLKKFVMENIIEALDHHYLNEDSAWQAWSRYCTILSSSVGRDDPRYRMLIGTTSSVNPTAENMVQFILWVLNKQGSPYRGHVESIRLSETPNSWATWRRKGIVPITLPKRSMPIKNAESSGGSYRIDANGMPWLQGMVKGISPVRTMVRIFGKWISVLLVHPKGARISKVYSNGKPLDAQSIRLSLETFVHCIVEDGNYIAFPSLGMFRASDDEKGVITCDAQDLESFHGIKFGAKGGKECE